MHFNSEFEGPCMNVIAVKKKKKKKKKNEYLGDWCEEEEEEAVKGERRGKEDERQDGEAKEYCSL